MGLFQILEFHLGNQEKPDLQKTPAKRRLRPAVPWPHALSLAVVFLLGPALVWGDDQATTLTVFPSGAYSLAVSPDGKTLAAGGHRDVIKVFSVPDWKEIAILRGHTGTVGTLVFSPDGKTLATVARGSEHCIRFWDTTTWNEQDAIRGETNFFMAWGPDGKTLAIAEGEGLVRLWDAGRLLKIARLEHPKKVYSVAFSPDGKLLACGQRGARVKVWDVAERKEVVELRAPKESVFAVAFSPDGKTLAAASGDGEDDRGAIKFWDVATWKERDGLIGSGMDWRCLQFSPDGKTLASGGYVGGVYLWDVETGKSLRVLKGHTSNVFAVAFSRDGKTLVSASSDHTVRLWNLSER